jgi:hypothetical protein
MDTGFRSAAFAIAIVGTFCTTLAFAPGLYFKAETAPQPAHPAPVTTGDMMIASADHPSETTGHYFAVASGAASTDRVIRLNRTGSDVRAPEAAETTLPDASIRGGSRAR